MLTRRMAKRQHCPLMPMAKIYETMSTVSRSTARSSNTKSVRAKNAPNGKTEKLTGRYAPMRKHAASVLRAIPAPTATATVEADHARLRRSEPPGMGGQA